MRALVRRFARRHVKLETLGGNFWSVKSPLEPVRERMEQCDGAVILALERFRSRSGVYREGSPKEQRTGIQLFPTVWNHIEGAMAYQLRLPLLILKERPLVEEGMLDPSIHDWLIVRVDPDDPHEFRRPFLKGVVNEWIQAVSNHRRDRRKN